MLTDDKVSIKFSGQIWKVHYNHGLILLELRDPETRTMNLAAVELNQRRVLWESLETDWWDTLAAISENYLVLSSYPDPQFPETKGLKVIDLSTGALRWKNDHLLFKGLNQEGILVEKENSAGIDCLDFETGKLLKTNVSNISDPNEDSEDELYTVPVSYMEGQEYYEEVKEFLHLKGIIPVKAIEYLEAGAWIIVGYYSGAAGILDFNILVLDEEGNIFFEEKSIDRGEGIGAAQFFVVKESLLFVRDKKEIVILNLSNQQ